MIPNEPFVPIMERPWYSDTERLEAYRICQQRGHQPSNVTLTVDPPLSVCRFCGTQYRYEEQVIEVNPPREESSDE